jgi:FkbM family methyltransferase
VGAGSTLRSLNAAIIRAADRIVPPENRVRRALSPVYSSVLNLLTAGRGYPAEINGQVFRIDAQFRWTAWHAHERELAAFLSARILPGQTCFDVGANVGIYVLQIARWSAPDGRIVAFEPNPATLPVLRRHIALNGLEARVTVVEKAAGARAGAAELFDSAAGSGLSRIGAPNPGIQVAVEPTSIAMTTIDAYCRETGIVPDWMLIDVEGYEFEVLQGAADTLRRHRLHVVVELHPHLSSPDSRAAGARLLGDLGLTMVPIGDVAGRTETYVSLETATGGGIRAS